VIPGLYHFSKFVCWLVLRLRCGLEVQGLEHVPRRGPYLVASNHVSYLDPVVVGVAAPRRLVFMARDTLFRQPLLASWMRGVGVIPLRREEADPAAIRAALAALRRGEPIGLFPEGGRQPGGVLGTARRGIGLLAIRARVPIIPVYLHGTFDVLPPDAKGLQPGKIRVAFGPSIPYTTASLPAADLVERSIPGREEGVIPPRRRQEQLADAVTQAWRRLAGFES
jgi:1-acyl-sn-glycerol-3-phosphate acyltransferase